MWIKNKAAILSKSFKGHNIRPHTGEGDEGGDAGDPTPARDYTLRKIIVTAKQFEKLVGEQAYQSFFNDGKKPAEPAFTSFSKIWLDDTYKNCAATFVLGVQSKTIEIADGVKISGIVLEPKTGGIAEMTCKVQACFPRTVVTLDMETYLGKEITASLRFGEVDEEETAKNKSGQADLVDEQRKEDASKDEGDGDEDEDEGDKPRRRRGGDQPRVN